MAEAKTRPTGVSVDEYLASKASAEQLADCRALMAICERVTRQPATMWGPSIVGFGGYTYRYESGRTGEAPLTGFAIRGRELVVYVSCEDPGQGALLARLGTHKMGKACLYFKRLAHLDTGVLEELIANSVATIQRRYPEAGDS
ncbi:DUF1801 domain-containing protein [Luteimonas sp. WGS1318]|uniref:DUF1801 domain-containing protein n=1 Tax=Luteimonas sp. WGS1318 TaxID=3366815 RepID=UPI00372D0BD7